MRDLPGFSVKSAQGFNFFSDEWEQTYNLNNDKKWIFVLMPMGYSEG